MKSRPLAVEQLEDRCVPATWGNPWPDAMHLTLSFAPDGTPLAGSTSNLQATLDTQTARATWQHEVLRAFQTWAVNANINIGLVADGGQAFGSAGLPQGDSRYGDIRIGGYMQPDDVEAIAMPFESMAGTWSGDVNFNTGVLYGANGQGAVDIFSSMLHEAGHVFGFPHSSDPASPMFETYQGIRSGLAASDVAMLLALYGVRQADRYEGPAGNDTPGTATRLSLLTDGDGSLGVAADGDVRTLQDRDYFRFQAPLTLGPLVISLQTSGLSLLTSKVAVYDSAFRAVGSAAASDPLHNDLTITVASPQLLGTYYVKIESATNDIFGIGSYHLEVKSLPLVKALTGIVSATVDTLKGVVADDLHTNDSFLTATLLPPVGNQAASRFDYAFRGRIRDSWDVDMYRVAAPVAQAGQETVLSVMVWGTETNGLKPRVSVYDAQHKLVDAEVLVNADGVFTVQVRHAVAGASYFVKVEAAAPHGANGAGNYFLGIDFSSQAIQIDQVTTGTLKAGTSSQFGMLTIDSSEMMHLVLSATGGPALVRLNVVDRQGRVVASVDAVSGRDAVSLTRALPAGQYLLHFLAFTADGSPLPEVHFTLKGSKISDPIGPRPENGSTQPAGSTSSSYSSTSPPLPPPNNSQPPQQPPPPPLGNSQPPSSQPPPSQQPSDPSPDEEYYSYYYDDWYEYQQTHNTQPDPYSPPKSSS